jgi:hypothetical protein
MTVKATACTAEGARTGSVHLRTHKRTFCPLRGLHVFSLENPNGGDNDKDT